MCCISFSMPMIWQNFERAIDRTSDHFEGQRLKKKLTTYKIPSLNGNSINYYISYYFPTDSKYRFALILHSCKRSLVSEFYAD